MANISISIVTPIIYKFLFDKDLLISIFIILIISVLMILFSIDLMKNNYGKFILFHSSFYLRR